MNNSKSRSKAANEAQTRPLLTSTDVEEWLACHVPYRVRASLTGLALQDEFLPPDADEERRRKIAEHCFKSSAWEGRLVAVRWLIEFIGAAEDPDSDPMKKKKTRTTDVVIVQLPGVEKFPRASDDAKFLFKVWKGCSQASGHPTRATNHPSVDPEKLDKALRIIVQHLERTIYASGRRNLRNETMIP
jgi:hypothetical protein